MPSACQTELSLIILMWTWLSADGMLLAFIMFGDRECPAMLSKYESTYMHASSDKKGEAAPIRWKKQLHLSPDHAQSCAPSACCSGLDQPWYSFNWGPIHFTMFSTEHATGHSSPQYKWLEADLKGVDRTHSNKQA
eukprot:645786-Pelagomonas_calceolata.AAC.1